MVLGVVVLEELVVDELVLDEVEVVVYSPYAGGPVESGLAKAIDAKVATASFNDWSMVRFS